MEHIIRRSASCPFLPHRTFGTFAPAIAGIHGAGAEKHGDEVHIVFDVTQRWAKVLLRNSAIC